MLSIIHCVWKGFYGDLKNFNAKSFVNEFKDYPAKAGLSRQTFTKELFIPT